MTQVSIFNKWVILSREMEHESTAMCEDRIKNHFCMFIMRDIKDQYM